jgi:hypothetical protein
MEIRELVLSEEDLEAGVDAISIVSEGAIEEDFIALSKKDVNLKTIDKEQRILMGPALIPDKMIYRREEENEYYIYFSKETVKKVSEAYLKRGYQSNSTLEHGPDIDGVCVVESWVVQDSEKDKAAYYNMTMPVGTWMVSMKVYNDDIWNDFVKTGKVNGFSIEGKFTENIQASLEQIEEAEAKDLLSKIRSIIKKDNRKKSGERIEMESYSDYPKAVSNNAKRGIELNEKVDNKCATRVGKIRAQQLANGEPVSVETIKRMASYLSRAETYYDANDTEACGTISYLLWGGKSALNWAEKKLKEIQKSNN